MKDLINIIRTRYGVDAMECDSTTVEWAADVMARTHGNEAAASAWKRLNAKRFRMGRHTSIPAFYSPLFSAYFAKAVA